MTCVHHTGQTSGVAIASAVFQARLDVELRNRIHVPGAEKVRAIAFLPVQLRVLTDHAARDRTFP